MCPQLMGVLLGGEGEGKAKSAAGGEALTGQPWWGVGLGAAGTWARAGGCKAGNWGTAWQGQCWEGTRLELEAGREHVAGWEAVESELQLFMAPLLQPPASNTLGREGAQ